MEVRSLGPGRWSRRVVASAMLDSASVQHPIHDARKKGAIIAQANGHRTKAAVLTDIGQVVLLAITSEAVAGCVGATGVGRVTWVAE